MTNIRRNLDVAGYGPPGWCRYTPLRISKGIMGIGRGSPAEMKSTKGNPGKKTCISSGRSAVSVSLYRAAVAAKSAGVHPTCVPGCLFDLACGLINTSLKGLHPLPSGDSENGRKELRRQQKGVVLAVVQRYLSLVGTDRRSF
jgi:hypothetical protein